MKTFALWVNFQCTHECTYSTVQTKFNDTASDKITILQLLSIKIIILLH